MSQQTDFDLELQWNAAVSLKHCVQCINLSLAKALKIQSKKKVNYFSGGGSINRLFSGFFSAGLRSGSRPVGIPCFQRDQGEDQNTRYNQ